MALQSKRTLSQDSDFPQTFSWSSETMNARQSYSQSVSSDIIRFDNLEIVAPITSSIVAALDPTTLEVAFDHSCLEGLDEQLLNFPTDAYAAICWAEAVNEPKDSDTYESRTSNTYDLSPPLRTYNLALIPPVPHTLHSNTKAHFFSSFGPSEKYIFEPRFNHFDPADSIGLFPIPQQKAKVTGVAAFRQYLPLRSKKSTNI